MSITLKGEQIYLMAQYAGLRVEAPDEDDKGTEYILEEEMEITINKDLKKYKGMGIYSVEYPEEGALPLGSDF